MTGISDTEAPKREFFRFWAQNGFAEIETPSIIPPDTWPYTLFMNSGLIKYLDIAKKENAFPYSLFACQPCIKLASSNLSLDAMLKRDGYFTFFEQLTCGAGEGLVLARFIERVWFYLTEVVGLYPQKIHIGVPLSQPRMKDFWIQAGAKDANILFPDSKAFILDLGNGEIQGVYSSFYYDRESRQVACDSTNCGINCRCGRFLELGDVGIIAEGNVKIIDHGIGLERIVAAKRNLPRVADIDQFSEIMSFLRSATQTDEECLLAIADHVRSAIIILSYGVKPGNKDKKYVLRNLLRRAFRLLSVAKPPEEKKVENIFRQVTLMLANHFPYLNLDEKIISEIIAELGKYRKVVANAERILRRFLQKRNKAGNLSPEEIKFLYETYGISVDPFGGPC